MSFEFPEPLFESHCYGNKICLVCGGGKATSALRTTIQEIFPICKDCSFNWNFYGYYILTKIKPKTLILNLIKFKIIHPLYSNIFEIYKNLQVIQTWVKKMRKHM